MTWADFRLEAFGEPYMVWHDGPDFAEFMARAGDPETATLVLEGLAEGDPLAAQAIGEAGMTDLAPQLKAELERHGGSFQVRAAESLSKLTGDQSWASKVAEVLIHPKTVFWNDRLDAAMALSRFAPTPELIAAVAEGMQDPEYLVRYHSTNTMLTYAGKPADVYSDDELFSEITDGSTPAQNLAAAARLAAQATAALPQG